MENFRRPAATGEGKSNIGGEFTGTARPVHASSFSFRNFVLCRREAINGQNSFAERRDRAAFAIYGEHASRLARRAVIRARNKALQNP